jgi:hypothetical protein
MSDRRRPQLELALRHLHDIREPSPKAPSMRAEAGFAPAHRIPCPDCGHTDDPGWHVDGFKRRTPCVTCGGQPADQGRKAKGGKGVVMVDPMDADRKAIGSTDTHATARPVRMVKCDACQDAAGEPTGMFRGERCPYCDGAGKRPLHVFNLQLDTREQADVILDHVQRQVDQRTKDTRWVQLERALCDLARHSWAARRLVERVYIVDAITLAELSMPGLEKLELGMRYLLTRLPLDWSAPAGLRANERLLRDRRTRARGRGQEVGRRDKEIREHARAGRSPGWIAAEYGLSVRTVYEVVNRKQLKEAS